MKNKISSLTNIPYFLVEHHLFQINPEILKIIEGQYVFSQYSPIHHFYRQAKADSYSKFKKAMVLIRKGNWQNYFYEERINNEVRYGILLDNEHIKYLILESNNLATQLLSNSLNKKIMEALKSLKHYDNALYAYMKWLRNWPFTTDQDRHFTVNSKGLMTYLPAGKPTITTDNDTWDLKNRQEIKYGKGIGKIIRNKLFHVHDSTIEQISNYIKACYNFEAKFEIVSGEDIRYWYHYHQYMPDQASLSQSCMRYEECQPYLDIYVNNQDKVQMLIARVNDKIIGRALIWSDITFEYEGSTITKTFMDRIYGNDLTIQNFLQYAKENDMVSKRYQSHTEPKRFIHPNGDEFIDNVEIQLKTDDLDYAPYMDTFKYTDDFYSGKLSNYNGEYSLTETGGYIPQDNEDDYVTLYNGDRVPENQARYSTIESEYYHEDDVYWSDYHDTYILREQAIEVDGEYYHEESDGIRYSEYEERYLREEDALWSEYMSDYIHVDNEIETILEDSIHHNEASLHRIQIGAIARVFELSQTAILQVIDNNAGVSYVPSEENIYITYPEGEDVQKYIDKIVELTKEKQHEMAENETTT